MNFCTKTDKVYKEVMQNTDKVHKDKTFGLEVASKSWRYGILNHTL